MSDRPKDGFTYSDAVITALETGDKSQLKEIGKKASERIKRMKAAAAANIQQTEIPKQTRVREEKPKRTPRKNGHIFKHGRCYWIKYSLHGRPYRENSQSDKESDARRLLNKRLGEIAVGRFLSPAADKVLVR